MSEAPSTSAAPSRPRTAYRWLLLLLVVIALVALLFAANQSQYLKTTALTPASPDAASGASEAAQDPYTLLEGHCQEVKQTHILECGMHAYPEDDYRCRTDEAEHHFQECMKNTNPESLAPLRDAVSY